MTKGSPPESRRRGKGRSRRRKRTGRAHGQRRRRLAQALELDDVALDVVLERIFRY